MLEYKTKLIGSTTKIINILETEVAVPLKYLSNFWRFLDFPLINQKTELDLSMYNIPNIMNTWNTSKCRC